MSYWWYALAAFVHLQAAFILFAVFPFPTTRQWNWILSTTIVKWPLDTFGFDIWNFYIVAIVPCCILCIDSLRDVAKYSQSDDFMDQTTRKDRKIQLLFSQRSYYICGAAFLFCILVPRILSLRKENGLLCQQIDRLKPVGKGIKKLMKMVNEVQQGQYSDDDDEQENIGGHNPTQNELLQLLVTELQKNSNRGGDRRGCDRPRPWTAQDMRELIEYYEQLKNQRAQDAANSNVQDHQAQGDPGNPRQRLARSRLTSPSGRGRIYIQVPQTHNERFRIISP